MSTVVNAENAGSLKQEFARLGARTLVGMAGGLLASCLIFFAPEVGLAGAVGGVVAGGISAFLMRPHHVL